MVTEQGLLMAIHEAIMDDPDRFLPGVEQWEDRIEWFNCAAPLSIEDLLRLANIEFYARECDKCGEMQRRGYPDDWADFQDVMQDDSGLLKIGNKKVFVCGSCYSELTSIGD